MAYSMYSVSKTKRESRGRVKKGEDRQPMSSLGETHFPLNAESSLKTKRTSPLKGLALKKIDTKSRTHLKLKTHQLLKSELV